MKVIENIIVITSSILLFLGILFTIFGYLIYFRKKYNLINNFVTDRKLGKYSNDYAKRIGIIEFVSGIILMGLGFINVIIGQKTFSLTSLLLCLSSPIIILIVNSIKSKVK